MWNRYLVRRRYIFLNSSTACRLLMPTRQNKSGIGTRASRPRVPVGATLSLQDGSSTLRSLAFLPLPRAVTLSPGAFSDGGIPNPAADMTPCNTPISSTSSP